MTARTLLAGTEGHDVDHVAEELINRLSTHVSVPDVAPWGGRWLRTASIGWFISIRIAVGLLGVLGLSAVRLLSERPVGTSGEEEPVDPKEHGKKNANRLYSPKRRYWQYCLETIWGGPVGSSGRMLATLSQRHRPNELARLADLSCCIRRLQRRSAHDVTVEHALKPEETD